MPALLILFLLLRLAQQVVETALARLNRRHALDPARLAEAGRALGIGQDEMAKAVAYSGDRHRFGLVYGWAEVLVGLAFLAAGGLGVVAGGAHRIAAAARSRHDRHRPRLLRDPRRRSRLSSSCPSTSTPPSASRRSTASTARRSAASSSTALKGVAIAIALGGPVLAAVLWLMERMGPSWWLWAWGVTTAFSLFAAWIYPTVLAPLFNKFTPLPDGELKDAILDLARRTGFRAGGISVMDASRRTAHGNAYFTGVFGQKRIVLFDTLLEAMGPREVVAVLAHELGHFKLHHVRWGMARGIATSGLVFFVLSLCLPLEAFYSAFSVGRTAYAALAVFGLWFGLVSFLLQPLENALSRRHEFAADAFALRNGATATELGDALRKLSEKSRHLPVTHPLYSRIYHSHPPLLERLRAMGALESA